MHVPNNAASLPLCTSPGETLSGECRGKPQAADSSSVYLGGEVEKPPGKSWEEHPQGHCYTH